MRGKRFIPLGFAEMPGITPADAGKTHGTATAERNPPGSPPRMRGKPVARDMAVMRLGITPADAGKTDSNYPFGGKRWDHPRGCGENTKKIL